ncbi:2-oxo acid dehydrogenase subunit E2 [Marinobacter sp.]|uniref:2-oxo acid dehydrogenase subunit E2 n=1 Tax=Marinobacter sp. TaxID=50741 RepID=UPI0025BA2CC2|nr:2-oxo acid dehydrogenase subunit E2 [Marinobacter sp.]
MVVLGELKSSGKGDGNGAQQDQFIVGAAPSSKRARANRDKVVPHNGTATIRRTLPLSLTFDHRAATGGEAARFLGAMMMALHNEG